MIILIPTDITDDRDTEGRESLFQPFFIVLFLNFVSLSLLRSKFITHPLLSHLSINADACFCCPVGKERVAIPQDSQNKTNSITHSQ